MSTLGYWKQRARAVIDPILQQGKHEQWAPEQTLKAVDSAYPFGPREHYPYKAWLEERTRARIILGIYKPRKSVRDAWIDKPDGQTEIQL